MEPNEPRAAWHAMRVICGGERAVALAALFAAGAQGVHEDRDALVTHFPPETDVARVVDAVRAVDPGARVEVGLASDTDWSEAWKRLLVAREVGGLTIVPPWLTDGLDPARTIVVDPGMAFGTGDHPTTRGVVRLMQALPIAGAMVADLGSGSAVLSIAAAKLGARQVVAVELDPDAMGNAAENVTRNGVDDRVRLIEGDATLLLPLLAPVDVVLANIVSSVHRELLPVVASSLTTGGHAVLSGILLEEEPAMRSLLQESGWRIDDGDVEDIWWSATIARR